MAIEELGRMPGTGALYRRAVAGVLPGRPGRRRDVLPETELIVRGVGVDREHLWRYARVCGFRLRDALPATYPHVLAFPLSLELMTRAGFPFPLFGLVHIENTIEQLRPLDAAERLDVAVRAANLRDHAKGRVVDLIATATVDDVVVWRGRSAYLRRERTVDGTAGQEGPHPPGAAALWRVGAEVGPAYAQVSGDRNPIHTSNLAARAFGLSRRIAHGMWSKARCISALDGRLPDQFTADVSFKLPILLPATVAFSLARTPDEGWRFALHDAKSGRPHLAGAVSA